MPILGHIEETGMIVHDEFREGNVSPGTRNLDFVKQCIAKMPTGKRIGKLRADGATYISDVFNFCEANKIMFAIGGRKDIAVMEND